METRVDEKRGAVLAWVEAMRLRTLPVSTAGVLAGVALGLEWSAFSWGATALCLVFAVLAQVASNFANEYYDFRAGLDKRGRSGPRRGVTEGDITPGAMRAATFIVLAVAGVAGVAVVWLYGAWWMYLAGVAVALGVMAYSTGPYPLSHHALGEVAVTLFFGVVPVCLTYLLEGAEWHLSVLWVSIGIGLMGANVLLVNNFRDRADDAAVGKRTLAVVFGPGVALWLYLVNGYAAVALSFSAWLALEPGAWVVPLCYLVAHTLLWLRLPRLRGASLNPMLGRTAMLMLAYSACLLIAAAW